MSATNTAMPSMQVISIPDAKEVIRHIAVKHQEPVMFWGKPGVGKSEGIRQAAEENEAEALVDIRLSQYDSVDLRGIPVPDAGKTIWNAPITLPFKGNDHFEQMDASKPIFLFLDEINSAVNSVAAVAYQLINDRRVGEHELLDNVVVIAAGNREHDRGVTNRMPTPLANRFTHYEIDVDVDAWCFHAQQKGWAPEGVAFMQFRKQLLCTFEDALKNGHKAFATPRTWEKALKYYSDPTMPDNIKQASMTGSIGEGPAAEFWGFVDVWGKMPDLKAIQKDPNKVPTPEEPAMRYAVSVAISGEMDSKSVPAFQQYLDRMDPEFNILAWQLAMRRDLTVCGTQEFIALSKKYRAVFAR